MTPHCSQDTLKSLQRGPRGLACVARPQFSRYTSLHIVLGSGHCFSLAPFQIPEHDMVLSATGLLDNSSLPCSFHIYPLPLLIFIPLCHHFLSLDSHASSPTIILKLLLIKLPMASLVLTQSLLSLLILLHFPAASEAIIPSWNFFVPWLCSAWCHSD